MAPNDNETVQDAYRRGCSEWEGVAVAWREGLLKCKAFSQNLQAENAALEARLAEAERLLREDARIFRLQAEAHRRRGTDASADEEMANGIYAFLHPQPPTAEGGETP